MRQPSYIVSGRSFFRLQTGEESYLEALGFPRERLRRGRHTARVFYSGIFSLPIEIGTLHLSAIHIRRPFGRFGNQYFQLVYALVLAKRLGVRLVLAPGNIVLNQVLEPVNFDGIDVVVDGGAVQWENPRWTLRWRAVVPTTHLTYNTFFAEEPGELRTPLTPDEIDHAIELVRDRWMESPKAALDEAHLVIHLRSGDVFSENPNPLYGQPPLSFYEKVLDDGEWAQVTIVSEDYQHPLMAFISELVESRGLKIGVQSGTFSEDVNFLRSAATLVASRGTFVPAVAGLSSLLRRIYSFGPTSGLHSSVEHIMVVDRVGTYWQEICQANWANSARQISLMTTYPARNLEISRG